MDGADRTYLLFVPEHASERQPLPLVFNLHGFGSNAAQQMAYTGIEDIAERDGWVVVAPEGAGTPQRFDLVGTSDVDFVLRTLMAVENEVCIDRARVYSMGMSNGGAMSSILGCRARDRIAAVAPVAAVIHVEAFSTDARPIPILSFMGTADPIVPFAGGRVNCCGNPTIGSASDAMARWARHNGCADPPTETRVGSDVVRREWSRCTDGADTVFHVVEGGGHTWPGAIPVERLGPTTSTVDATATILDFFRKH